MRGSQGERLVVELRGHDLETAARLATRVEAAMKSVPGIADVRIGREEGSRSGRSRSRPSAPPISA